LECNGSNDHQEECKDGAEFLFGVMRTLQGGEKL
jgi:hypothetical protein